MEKTCTKCKRVLPIEQFHHDSSRPSGVYPSCKECNRKEKRRYFATNRRKVLDGMKRHRDSHKAEYAARRKADIERRRQWHRNWKQRNKEHCKAWRTAYAERRKHDPVWKMKKMLRNRLLYVLREAGTTRCEGTLSLLGCSFETFVTHIESLFQQGMTWDNHGRWKTGEPMKWHIDHIRPCASFDLTDPEQQKQCFHYTNLQPLWADQNLIKNARPQDR
jgi:hypothetical protein